MRRKEGGQDQSISQLVCQTPLPFPVSTRPVRIVRTVLVEKEWQKFERDISSRHVVAHRSRGKPHPEPFRGVRLSWSRLFAFGGNTDLKSIVIIRPMCFFCVRFIHNFSWKIHASDRKSYFFNCHAFKIVKKRKSSSGSTISKAKTGI